MAGLASEYDVVMVARADGTLAADVRPLVRLSVTVIAEQNGRREMGSGGGGGRFGLAYFDDAHINEYVNDAVNAALTNLESRPAPAGEMTVVLGPGWPASCCTRPSAMGWRATSTARAPAPSAAASASVWRPRA
jgi:TldD protein